MKVIRDALRLEKDVLDSEITDCANFGFCCQSGACCNISIPVKDRPN